MIINPMFFYWSEVFNLLKMFGLAIAIILFVVLLFVEVDKIESQPWTKEENSYNRTIFALIVSCIIGFLMFIFLPSKDTMIEMQVASMVTTENIDATKGEVKEVIDYVFDKMNNMKGDKNG